MGIATGNRRIDIIMPKYIDSRCKFTCFQRRDRTHIDDDLPFREPGRDAIWPAVRLLRRASDALDLVNDNTLMLEHLAPADYHIVRNGLGHGSGFDSPGFRNIHERGSFAP